VKESLNFIYDTCLESKHFRKHSEDDFRVLEYVDETLQSAYRSEVLVMV